MTEKAFKEFSERQRQIIEASLTIVDKDGIHGLTLKRIGSALGISDAALLRHFSSKDEMVEAMAMKVFQENIVPEAAPGVNDPGRALASLLRRQFETFESFPQATAVLFQEEIFREYPKLREWFVQRRRERHENIAMMIKKAKKNGFVGKDIDPEEFATVFTGAMRMAVMEWRDSGYAGSLAARSDPISELLVRTLR